MDPLSSEVPNNIPINPPPDKPVKVSNNSFICLAAANIPPLAKPANTSPNDIFSVIHEKTSFIPVHIPFTVFDTASPIPVNDSPKPVSPFITPPITWKTPVNMLVKPLRLNRPFKAVNKSPIPAVNVSTKSINPENIPEENRPPTNLATETIIFLAKSTIENKPLNVLFSLSAVSSLILKFSVNFLRPKLKS